MLYASYLGGVSNNINGGQLTLYAIAAAVLGGTSLFGGRGRVMHGVLGGLVIGGIYNGMCRLRRPRVSPGPVPLSRIRPPRPDRCSASWDCSR